MKGVITMYTLRIIDGKTVSKSDDFDDLLNWARFLMFHGYEVEIINANGERVVDL